MSAIDRVKELLAAATAECVCTDYRCEHRAAAMELSCVLSIPIAEELVASQEALSGMLDDENPCRCVIDVRCHRPAADAALCLEKLVMEEK